VSFIGTPEMLVEGHQNKRAFLCVQIFNHDKVTGVDVVKVSGIPPVE
jgi:hypothetical protein